MLLPVKENREKTNLGNVLWVLNNQKQPSRRSTGHSELTIDEQLGTLRPCTCVALLGFLSHG